MARTAAVRLFLITACLGLMTAQARAGDAEDWGRRHAVIDAALNAGNGYAGHADSATLAWAESYILTSYLTMYRATGDTGYLDTIVRHADQILANAADPDGDGRLGWGTYRYSLSRARNGEFDERASSLPDALLPASRRKLPRHWSRWQSNQDTAYRAVEGDNPIAVVRSAPGEGWQVLETRLVTYTPGASYQVTFRGKTDGAAAGGRVDVIDKTAGRQIAQQLFSNTAWRTHVFTFQAPSAAGHELYLRLYHRRHDVAGAARFDAVKVQKHLAWMVHDGMITWPLADFAAIVLNDPSLAGTYGAHARRYVHFTQTHVLPRWEAHYRAVPSGGGTYVFPPDSAYAGWHGNSQPHNQVLALGRTYAHLYRATGAPGYLTRARALARAFLDRVEVDGDTYRWRYNDVMLPSDHQDRSGWEDTSHANIELGFAQDMFALGQVFRAADMQRFAATFQQKLWNQSWSSPSLASRVDGGGDDRYAAYIGEWTRLGRFPGNDIARIVESLYEHRGWHLPAGAMHVPTSMLVTARLAVLSGIPNGGLEVAATHDPTLPAGWSRWQSLPGTAFRDSNAAAVGRHCATVVTDPNRGWQVLQHRLRGYAPATPMSLTFRARTNGSSAGGRVDVLDRTSGRILATRAFSNTRWTRHVLRLQTPPVSRHELLVRVYHQRWDIPGGIVQVDDVSLEEGSPGNGDFEAPELVGSGVLSGSLLPARWQRWQSTGATAFLDTASAHSGRAGLTIRTNPSRGWQVVQQRLDTYAPGEEVEIAVWGRATNATAGARVQVYDFTAGRTLANLAVHDTSWTRHTARWHMPADPDHDIRVRLMHVRWDVSNATARFDGITLRAVRRATPQPATPAPRIR
jgi:hypothetical protein